MTDLQIHFVAMAKNSCDFDPRNDPSSDPSVQVADHDYGVVKPVARYSVNTSRKHQ